MFYLSTICGEKQVVRWQNNEARAREQQERAAADSKAAEDAAVRLANLDDYVAGRLATVREQIARLDQQLLRVEDEDKANKLAAAIARMTDVEFALANRPKPANVRPEAQRAQRRRFEVPAQ